MVCSPRRAGLCAEAVKSPCLIGLVLYSRGKLLEQAIALVCKGSVARNVIVPGDSVLSRWQSYYICQCLSPPGGATEINFLKKKRICCIRPWPDKHHWLLSVSVNTNSSRLNTDILRYMTHFKHKLYPLFHFSCPADKFIV